MGTSLADRLNRNEDLLDGVVYVQPARGGGPFSTGIGVSSPARDPASRRQELGSSEVSSLTACRGAGGGRPPGAFKLDTQIEIADPPAGRFRLPEKPMSLPTDQKTTHAVFEGLRVLCLGAHISRQDMGRTAQRSRGEQLCPMRSF
jgi:hypothetical protein